MAPVVARGQVLSTGRSGRTVSPSDETAVDVVLRQFLGYRLKRAYNVIRAGLLVRLEPLGLRITTFSALALIVDNAGIRQSALAVALDIKRSNMVAIIDDLESKELVVRRESPSDRRAFALYPTKSGRRLCRQALALTKENEAHVTEQLSSGDLSKLLAALETIESCERKDQ